jgi:hypothetical protein
MSLAAKIVVQLGGLLGGPLGHLLLAIAGVGVVVLVGRVLLKIAWRLVTIAAVVVGVLLLVSMFLL